MRLGSINNKAQQTQKYIYELSTFTGQCEQETSMVRATCSSILNNCRLSWIEY